MFVQKLDTRLNEGFAQQLPHFGVIRVKKFAFHNVALEYTRLAFWTDHSVIFVRQLCNIFNLLQVKIQAKIQVFNVLRDLQYFQWAPFDFSSTLRPEWCLLGCFRVSQNFGAFKSAKLDAFLLTSAHERGFFPNNDTVQFSWRHLVHDYWFFDKAFVSLRQVTLSISFKLTLANWKLF